MGLRVEALMNIEEMLTVDPSGELHEEPLNEMSETGVSSHCWFATDDLSGANLVPELVAEARKEEINYFKSRGVYEKVPIEECWHQTGKPPIAVRCVDINKSDGAFKNHRDRLMAKEFKTHISGQIYSQQHRPANF